MVALKLKELRTISTDELIRRHDNIANNTGGGLDYYLNEITRRDQEEHTKTILKYTRFITFMTLIITLSTIINLIIIAIR